MTKSLFAKQGEIVMMYFFISLIQLFVGNLFIDFSGNKKFCSHRHNLHVSYLKVAIEGKNAIMKVSFFKDDLTLALKTNDSEFKNLVPSAALDEQFTRYIKNRLEILIGGSPIKLSVTSSGEEGDMWWYQIEFRYETPIKEFEIKNACLMEIYDDQKNIIQIMHFPKEKTYSYYCIAGSNRYKVILE